MWYNAPAMLPAGMMHGHTSIKYCEHSDYTVTGLSNRILALKTTCWANVNNHEIEKNIPPTMLARVIMLLIRTAKTSISNLSLGTRSAERRFLLFSSLLMVKFRDNISNVT